MKPLGVQVLNYCNVAFQGSKVCQKSKYNIGTQICLFYVCILFCKVKMRLALVLTCVL